MKVTFDTADPAQVAEVKALLGGTAALDQAVAQASTPRAPAPAPVPAAAPAAPSYTQADVSAALQTYVQSVGPQQAKAKLAELGAKKASDIAPERYAEAMAIFSGQA